MKEKESLESFEQRQWSTLKFFLPTHLVYIRESGRRTKFDDKEFSGKVKCYVNLLEN